MHLAIRKNFLCIRYLIMLEWLPVSRTCLLRNSHGNLASLALTYSAHIQYPKKDKMNSLRLWLSFFWRSFCSARRSSSERGSSCFSFSYKQFQIEWDYHWSKIWRYIVTMIMVEQPWLGDSRDLRRTWRWAGWKSPGGCWRSPPLTSCSCRRSPSPSRNPALKHLFFNFIAVILGYTYWYLAWIQCVPTEYLPKNKVYSTLISGTPPSSNPESVDSSLSRNSSPVPAWK